MASVKDRGLPRNGTSNQKMTISQSRTPLSMEIATTGSSLPSRNSMRVTVELAMLKMAPVSFSRTTLTAISSGGTSISTSISSEGATMATLRSSGL